MGISLDFVRTSFQQIADKCPEREGNQWAYGEMKKSLENCSEQLEFGNLKEVVCKVLVPAPNLSDFATECQKQVLSEKKVLDLTKFLNEFIKEKANTDQEFNCMLTQNLSNDVLNCVSADQTTSLTMNNYFGINYASLNLIKQTADDTTFNSGSAYIKLDPPKELIPITSHYLKEGNQTPFDPNGFVQPFYNFLTENSNLLLGAGLLGGAALTIERFLKTVNMAKTFKAQGYNQKNPLPAEENAKFWKSYTQFLFAASVSAFCTFVLIKNNP